MDFVLPRYLLDRFYPLERFQRYPGFEFWFVSSAFRSHCSLVLVEVLSLPLSLQPFSIAYPLVLFPGSSSGSRFMRGGGTIDYPAFKLFVNRLANFFVRLMFRHGLNDTTNAFKAYRRKVILGCEPLIAPHFNLTVEIPLKAIVRGYSWTVMPITWRNRRFGEAKLKIKEMGSRYFFICAYVWLEKYFSRGDYHQK